jgi:taurine dioxygenase
MTQLDLRPLTPVIGAEVHGVDLSAGLDESTFDAVHAALLEYQVLFAPGQFLDTPALRAVASRFGDFDISPISPKVDGYPDVTEIVSREGGAPDIWHFDGSYTEAPPTASFLSMVSCPPVGGDTLWLNAYLVYESLSAPLRELVDGLHVIYDVAVVGKTGSRGEHPLVRIHPETGRKSLYLDPMFSTRVVELGKDESDALLTFLRNYINDPRFACRYHWTPGTFAVWDNRCTLHRVTTDFEGERTVCRVTIVGEKPVGHEPRWPQFTARRGASGDADRRNLDPAATVPGY